MLKSIFYIPNGESFCHKHVVRLSCAATSLLKFIHGKGVKDTALSSSSQSCLPHVAHTGPGHLHCMQQGTRLAWARAVR